jgi:cytochrome c oxidase subunit 2
MTRLALFPPRASTMAPQVDALLFFLLGVTAVFVVLIAGLIVCFMVRYRRRADDERPIQIHGSLALEALWIAVPFAIAMVTFFWGASLYAALTRPPDDALLVNVVGRQWMWKMQHLEGRREINELHVPLGRPIKLVMTSEDVIHSFYVPAFRVKQDAIPGRYTEVWFEATRPGRYHLFCAEYCGTLHSGMIGSVVVMEPPAFEQWLAGGPALSPAQHGLKLFQDLGCETCHRGDALARCPDLTALFGRPVRLRTGQTVIADEAYLRESIIDPGAKIVAGYENIMPTFKGLVTEEGILDLIAWVRSLGGTQEARP